MFRVHSVGQRPNLRHLGEPLGGAKSLLEAVSFNKATAGMGRGRVANARWERVPHSGGCNTNCNTEVAFPKKRKNVIQKFQVSNFRYFTAWNLH